VEGANYGIATSNCKAFPKIANQWYVGPLLNKGNIVPFGDNLSRGSIKKSNLL
jgi:hypothetical protein